LIHPVVFAETLGSVTVQVTYTNGDRTGSFGLTSKIYQDFNKNPYREIDSVSDVPFDITSLPLNHQYKIEVYINGILAGVNYANLQNEHQDMNIKIPLPGGMRFNVFYNDGQTPISNALIEVETQDNKTWGTSSTDVDGQTTRFLVSSHYKRTDLHSKCKDWRHLSYSYSQYHCLLELQKKSRLLHRGRI